MTDSLRIGKAEVSLQTVALALRHIESVTAEDRMVLMGTDKGFALFESLLAPSVDNAVAHDILRKARRGKKLAQKTIVAILIVLIAEENKVMIEALEAVEKSQYSEEHQP